MSAVAESRRRGRVLPELFSQLFRVFANVHNKKLENVLGIAKSSMLSPSDPRSDLSMSCASPDPQE